MINYSINPTSLLKWARYLEEVPAKTNKNIALSLNTVGENVVRELSLKLSVSTGMDPETVRRLIKVRRATESSLKWSVDIADVLEPTGAKRTLPKRQMAAGEAEQRIKTEQLVNVVTMRDDRVCPICDDIRTNGPYTPQEVEAMSARLNHYGGGLFHPHCRCGTTPFNPARRLIAGRGDHFGNAAMKQVTVKQIADEVRKNTTLVLKAPKSFKVPKV